jgi:hypothetical protein
VEHPRVRARVEHVDRLHETAERARERLLRRHPRRGQVRRIVMHRRHLHEQLTAGGKRRGEPGEQRRMVGHPVQRRVREDEVVVTPRGKGLDVAPLEAKARTRVGLRLLEHRGRCVDADRLSRAHPTMEFGGQLAGAATEIHDPLDLCGLEQRDQILKGSRSLVAEPIVARWLPRVGPVIWPVIGPVWAHEGFLVRRRGASWCLRALYFIVVCGTPR